MTIHTEQIDTATTALHLEGRLDTTTFPALESALQEIPETVLTVILDFAQLTYISSAGLRTILSTQKKMNARHGSLILRHVSENIMEVFELTGFDSFLTIE